MESVNGYMNLEETASANLIAFSCWFIYELFGWTLQAADTLDGDNLKVDLESIMNLN